MTEIRLSVRPVRVLLALLIGLLAFLLGFDAVISLSNGLR